MKKVHIFLVTLSLLATAALLTGAYSKNAIALKPGPVKVEQGKNVSLWCKLNNYTEKVPVLWQSPPEFKTRTHNCRTFEPSSAKQKYKLSCAENPVRWYNLTIMDVQWADRGEYRCIITGHMGIVKLQVYVPVTEVSLTHNSNNTAEPLLLSPNTEIVLTCTTNCASTTPTISWFENDQPFNDSPIANNTESGCTADKEGLRRTISRVAVIGNDVGNGKKVSTIFCKAENIWESKFSTSIGIKYNVTPSPLQPVMAKSGTIAAVVVPVLVVIAIIITVVVIVVRRKHRNKKRQRGTALMVAPKELPDVELTLLSNGGAAIDREKKVSGENSDFSWAETSDKKLHAHLLTVLDEKLKDEEVQRLIHLLKTAKTIPLHELAKCNSIYDVWSSLERSQKLAIGEYDELSEWMGMLKRKDCVDVINDYKGKIKDYREYHQRGESLVDAAINDDATEVRKLLSEGGVVDYQRISDGWTALIRASHYGHLDIVDALLEGGAEVNKVNKDGWTALLAASINGHHDVLDALLKGGAEVNKAYIKDGWTALMVASHGGHLDVLNTLLGQGAEVNKENKNGATALYMASQNGHLDVVDSLLKGGADVNKEKKNGFTALMLASQNGHIDVVDVLLKKGAAINKINKYGYTAVMTASKCGHLDVVDALLKKGAAIDKTSKDGHWTPLKLAEYGKHTEVVEFLKKSGAKR